MISHLDLINKIKSYHQNIDESLITKAYIFARTAHGNQTRHSGEPYFSHPIAVAEITIELKLDQSSIITALLHDVVEDTEISLEEIKKIFGEEIANLVDGVTKLGKLEVIPTNEKFAENFRKLTIAMSRDIRVLLIKLADRLHNMRTLYFVPSKEKKIKKSRESLDIYAPLASRIGLNKIKDELQDLAFEIIEPEARNYIINRLAELQEKTKDLTDKIINDLNNIFNKEEIVFKISGRQKQPYSIWEKMQKRNIGFHNLHDIMAFRITVENIADCYKALGIINSNYQMIPGSFKDYISTPKENGYQSLHLVILGPFNKKIEIQIRDNQMHEISELGVAAHWRYKTVAQHKNLKNSLDNETKQYRWLRELVGLFENSESASEVLKNHKLILHSDQIFCFTPNGDIFNLPINSTLVDFAYAIHSEVGNSCISAKVNGVIAPLKQKIENGDQIEIITAKNAKPSPNWLQFVNTSKARYAIKSFIKNEKFSEYSVLGRAIINKFFINKNFEINDKILEKTLSHFNKKTIADLCFKIAEGSIHREEVLKIAYPEYIEESKKNIKNNKSFEKKIKDSYSIPINGLVSGMAIQYAGCCKPIPGDSIVGIINTGTGVTIHYQNCHNLKRLAINKQRVLDVCWKDEEDLQNQIYQSRIRLVIENKSGTIADISSIVAKRQVNISGITTINRSADYLEIMMDLEVKTVEHLETILSSLRTSRNVVEVERLTSRN